MIWDHRVRKMPGGNIFKGSINKGLLTVPTNLRPRLLTPAELWPINPGSCKLLYFISKLIYKKIFLRIPLELYPKGIDPALFGGCHLVTLCFKINLPIRQAVACPFFCKK